jgi:hypothetical protein
MNHHKHACRNCMAQFVQCWLYTHQQPSQWVKPQVATTTRQTRLNKLQRICPSHNKRKLSCDQGKSVDTRIVSISVHGRLGTIKIPTNNDRLTDYLLANYLIAIQPVTMKTVEIILCNTTSGQLCQYSDSLRADGQWIERRWGRLFLHIRPDRPWVPPRLTQWVPRLSPGGKAATSRRWPPAPSRAEVKQGVELFVVQCP